MELNKALVYWIEREKKNSMYYLAPLLVYFWIRHCQQQNTWINICMYSSHACTATVPGCRSEYLMGSPENRQNRLDGNRKLNELLDRCIIDPCMPRPRVLDWYQIDRKGGRPASMQATSSADEWSPSPSRIGGVSLARSGVLQRCPLYAWVHASSIRACLPACCLYHVN